MVTNIILNVINKFDKIYIYSPSLHQSLYQKLIECYSNYISINIIPNILKENDIDVVIDEICSGKEFKKSDIEIETFCNIEELKYLQEYNSDQPTVNILDDLYQKKWMILEFKHCLNYLDIITYQYLFLGKIITNYQGERLKLMVIFTTFLNQTISEMFKISIKTTFR